MLPKTILRFKYCQAYLHQSNLCYACDRTHFLISNHVLFISDENTKRNKLLGTFPRLLLGPHIFLNGKSSEAISNSSVFMHVLALDSPLDLIMVKWHLLLIFHVTAHIEKCTAKYETQVSLNSNLVCLQFDLL